MGIGTRWHITNVILDKNVQIGNNVTIIGGKHMEDVETPEYKTVDGILVVKKGIIISLAEAE